MCTVARLSQMKMIEPVQTGLEQYLAHLQRHLENPESRAKLLICELKISLLCAKIRYQSSGAMNVILSLGVDNSLLQ